MHASKYLMKRKILTTCLRQNLEEVLENLVMCHMLCFVLKELSTVYNVGTCTIIGSFVTLNYLKS